MGNNKKTSADSALTLKITVITVIAIVWIICLAFIITKCEKCIILRRNVLTFIMPGLLLLTLFYPSKAINTFMLHNIFDSEKVSNLSFINFLVEKTKEISMVASTDE